jgi:hypothetical protein
LVIGQKLDSHYTIKDLRPDLCIECHSNKY